jgi:hypothetical protein
MCLLIALFVFHQCLTAHFKDDKDADRISMGHSLAARSAAASAVLRFSSLLTPDSHVKNTLPLLSLNQLICLLMLVIVGSACCLASRYRLALAATSSLSRHIDDPLH